MDIEKILDEMDKEIANSNTKFLTHEEVFSKLRAKQIKDCGSKKSHI